MKHRNFVAKHAKSCGAGRHIAKNGKRVSRARAKQNSLREAA